MKNLDMEVFRRRVRDRLKQLNMKQYQLADKAEISHSTLDKWLSGGLVPSLEKIYKVSQVLGVSVDWLINPDMECLTVSNQMISDYTGLSDDAISGLLNIKQSDNTREQCQQQALCVLPVLNEILGLEKGRAFLEILQVLNRFLHTSYFVPVQHDDKGNVNAVSEKYDYAINPKARKKKISKVGSISFATDFYIQYFGRENDLHDNIPIAINKEFMQAVALKQLEQTLIQIKQDIDP